MSTLNWPTRVCRGVGRVEVTTKQSDFEENNPGARSFRRSIVIEAEVRVLNKEDLEQDITIALHRAHVELAHACMRGRE